MTALDDFLTGVQTCFSASDGAGLLRHLQLSAPADAALKRDLQNQKEVSTLVSRRFQLAEADRFESFLTEFLTFVAAHPRREILLPRPPDGHDKGKNPSLSPEQWNAAYQAFALVFSRANMVYNLPDSVWFAPALRYISSTLISLAVRADALNGSRKLTRTMDAAGRLSKAAGTCGNDRTPAGCEQTRRFAVMFLANDSFRAYFKINNIRLCETVLGSVNAAIESNRRYGQGDLSGEDKYPLADRVTMKYYVGRLRLSQHRIRQAYINLRWAFDHCTNSHTRNKRRILVPLLSAALILGYYPPSSLLTAFNLWEPFGPLIHHLRLGAGSAALAHLTSWREWHRKHGTYLLMQEKLPISIWRNLVRRTCLLTLDSAPAGAPPTLSLHALLTTARLAWADETLTIDDAECIAVSLIDQGYLKAYILHSKRMLVLQRAANLGFPPVRTIVVGSGTI